MDEIVGENDLDMPSDYEDDEEPGEIVFCAYCSCMIDEREAYRVDGMHLCELCNEADQLEEAFGVS